MDSLIGARSVDSIESYVADLWRRELCVAEINSDSDFFALGGDSVRMLNMLFQIRDAFGIEIAPGAMFENATLARFASVVVEATASCVQQAESDEGRI